MVSDGLSELELEAIDSLSDLAAMSDEAASAVLGMPFLESVEPNDVLAIRGLWSLGYSEEGTLLSDVLTHPTFVNGITDDQTTLFAAAGTLLDPEEIRLVLHPGYALIESIEIPTTLSPNLKMSIVRTGRSRPPRTAEAVRAAVTYVKDVMATPIPVENVVVVLNEKRARQHSTLGVNHGFAFTLAPDLEGGTHHRLRTVILHEVAHYYWHLGPGWIDEGVADTFEYMWGIEAGIPDGLLSPYRGNCETPDLSSLSALTRPEAQRASRCNYFLGQMLFQELWEDAGKEEFNKGLRRLYTSLLESDYLERGIAQVRQTFPGQSTIVEKHWSGKVNAPENRPVTLPWPYANLIEWNEPPTYNGRSVTFRGTLLGDAVLVKQTIEQARTGGFPNFTLNNTDGFGYVGTILPPLAPDDNRYWILDNPGDVVASTYTLRDSTFTVRFVFPSQLDSPERYAVLVRGFYDETRTPITGGSSDILGYAVIRSDE